MVLVKMKTHYSLSSQVTALIGALIFIGSIVLYGPLLRAAFNSEDQFCFFTEMQNAGSLQDQLYLLFDYSPNRHYVKGDTFLFRPLLFLLLALEYKIFSFHPFGWNFLNLCIHLTNLFLLYRFLRRLGSKWSAAVIVLFFAFHNPPRFLITNNHMGGYLLACTFLLAAFKEMWSLAHEREISRKCIGYYIGALTAGVFFYEMLVVFCLLMTAFVLWNRMQKFREWSPRLVIYLTLPALVFLSVFIPRTLLLERPMIVGTESFLSRIFTLDRIQLTLTAIKSFVSTYAMLLFPRSDYKWNTVLLLFASIMVSLRILQRDFFSKWISFAVLILSMFLSYITILAFFRPEWDQGHYLYLGYLLIFILGYVSIDWDWFSGKRGVVSGILAVVLAGHFFYASWLVTQRTLEEQAQSDRYFAALTEFVDRHKQEPEFSFKILSPLADIDPFISMQSGYADSGKPELKKRISEILFASYWKEKDPRYLLTFAQDGRLSARQAGETS